MGEVVQFKLKAVPIEDDRHTCGPHVCALCGHREPVCIAPLGVKNFECVKCGRMSSQRENPVQPGDGVWRAKCSVCGCQQFSVMPRSLMCSACGTEQVQQWSDLQ